MRLLTRVARRIVGLYPRDWRARYEQEMLGLLADRPPTLFQCLDLLRGSVSERTSPVLVQMLT